MASSRHTIDDVPHAGRGPATIQDHPVVLVVEQIGTGGITRAVFNQAGILLEHGFDVTLATVIPEREDFLDKADRGGLWHPGLKSRNLAQEWPERWAAAGDDPRAIARLKIAWLTSVVSSQATKPYLIAEHRETIPLIQQISGRKAIKIAVVHDNQFKGPRKGIPLAKQSPLIADTTREHMLGGIWSLNALVGLTEHQTSDLRKLAGPWGGRVHGAPNEAHMPTEDYPDPEPDKITIVSRLIPRKRIQEILHAFAIVVARRPATTMDVYGGGASKAGLVELAEKLGLSDSVTFFLSTVTPLQAMATGHCGVLTSTSEAMTLTLLESYSVGRPVISYRFRYGPESMIEDGVTGYLVADRDRETLAERMIELLDDPAKALAMGRAGRELARQRYSREQVWRSWEAFLTAARQTRSRRLPPWLTAWKVPLRGESVPLLAAGYRLASRRARSEIGW